MPANRRDFRLSIPTLPCSAHLWADNLAAQRAPLWKPGIGSAA